MVVNANSDRLALEFKGIDDDDYFLANQATSDSVVTTVSSGDFLNQVNQKIGPTCGMVVITPGGTTADVPAGDITVVGEDMQGNALTDILTLTANQASAEEGDAMFSKVTSIAFPAQDGAAATYDFGLIPDMDMLLNHSDHMRLLEWRMSTASALVASENIVATSERPDDAAFNFQLSSDDVATKTLIRKTGIDLDGLTGMKLRWAWDDTDNETWGFVAVFKIL